MRVRDQAEPVWERPVLNAFAVLVLALMIGIVAQVVCSQFDINPIIVFDAALPLVGDAVTLNSLLDAQWHLLVVIALLPAWLVWRRDGHVRVDFLYRAAPAKGRDAIDLVGHFVFTAPFLFLAIPAAWSFMMSAYRSGQGSTNDGLNDLFLVKALLPVGLAFLAVMLVVDAIALIRRLVRR